MVKPSTIAVVVGGAVGGGTIAAVAAPVVLSAVGFTAAGKLMIKI